MKLPAQTYDWALIKRLYTEGKTAYAISKLEGMPTKQAIMYQIDKGCWGKELATAKELLPTLAETDRAATAARVLAHLKSGDTHKLACAKEGIAESTWRNWRTDDPMVAAKADQAQADYVSNLRGKIEVAADRDWKAAQSLMDRHPMAREEYHTRETSKGEGGITIVLNIDRAEPGENVIDVTPERV